MRSLHRRAWFGAALLLCAGASAGAAGPEEDATRIAAQAAAAYQAHQHEDATVAYGRLTWEGGSQDADVWYNAGNAHARAGQRGAAIGAYRTALGLAPRHADAAANLTYLRDQVGVEPAGASNSFVAWLVKPAMQTSASWWHRCALGAWCVAWCAAAIGFWRPQPWRNLAQVTAVFCAFCAVGWGAHLFGRSREPRAIVIASAAPLRTGPGPDYLLTYSLPDGAECVLVSRQAGWTQLQLSDGATGWTEAERVLILPLGDPTPGRAPARWDGDL